MEKKAKYIFEHTRHLKDSKYVDRSKLKAGDIIQFLYDGEKKTVMVLNPYWEQKLHALDLNSIPRLYFLPILREAGHHALKPKAFYEIKMRQDPRLIKYKAYRTFTVDKLGIIHKLDYK